MTASALGNLLLPAGRPITAAVSDPDAVYPCPVDVAELAAQYDLVPLCCTIRLDCVSPTEAVRRLCQSAEDTGAEEPGFLLESAGPHGAGRWSTVGFRPRPLDSDDPVPMLDALCRTTVAPVGGLPPFRGGAVGYLGWESARHAEPCVPRATGPAPELPESAFMLAEDLVVFDHAAGDAVLLTIHRPGRETYRAAVDRLQVIRARLRRRPGRAPAPIRHVDDEWCSDTSRTEFEATVRRAQEHIKAGDVFQVVLSQRFSRGLGSTPLALYRALRATNPSPYMFLFCLGSGRYVIGASPELLLRNDGDRVRTRPLAGTRPRGTDPGQDAALEADLRADTKELAEHVMLVDLGRNDIGRVAAPGSVSVDTLAEVERWSHVMHLSSTVSGTLADGRTAVDALRSAFPAGTLSGAPKIRAMQLIAELEGNRRGVYGGALGTVGYGGAVDMAIVLRTFVLARERLYVQSGAGVVADSDPAVEFLETLHKAAALFAAAERAEAER